MDITITNGQLTATINPKGAELTSLKSSDGNEYIWEGDPAFWGKHSPVLFPIVGTLKNNSYLYKGTIYALSRHGFARDAIFTVIEKTESSTVFSLSSNNDSRTVYPFDFELQLSYTLSNKTLQLQYTVINKGSIKMPFSIGAHPAFALPGNFESYSLAFEKEEPLVSRQLENDLLSAKTDTLTAPKGLLPLSYSLFENDALIFTSLRSREITIVKAGRDILKVSFNDFPHLGIWTKKDAPFICIEPWQGYSDAPGTKGNLIEKEGIVILGGKESYTAGLAVQILE